MGGRAQTKRAGPPMWAGPGGTYPKYTISIVSLLTKVTYGGVLYESVCRSPESLGAPAGVHGNSAQLMSDTLCGHDGSPVDPASLSPRPWTARTMSADLRATDVASGPPGTFGLQHAADADTGAGTRWGAAAVLRDYSVLDLWHLWSIQGSRRYPLCAAAPTRWGGHGA